MKGYRQSSIRSARSSIVWFMNVVLYVVSPHPVTPGTIRFHRLVMSQQYRSSYKIKWSLFLTLLHMLAPMILAPAASDMIYSNLFSTDFHFLFSKFLFSDINCSYEDYEPVSWSQVEVYVVWLTDPGQVFVDFIVGRALFFSSPCWKFTRTKE